MLNVLKQKWKSILIIIFMMLFFQHTALAEVATATDQSDLVVAGKIIQEQHKNKA